MCLKQYEILKNDNAFSFIAIEKTLTAVFYTSHLLKSLSLLRAMQYG